MANVTRKLKRFLRSPKTITVELLGIASAVGLMTTVPQAADRADWLGFASRRPELASVVRLLLLDRVLHSPWFGGLLVLAAASLGIVLVEQWQRALREWREPLIEASFRSAPYSREGSPIGNLPAGAGATFSTTGRLGLWGTPLFHLGVMLVLVAGLARALFASEAVFELVEGEGIGDGGSVPVEVSGGPLAAAFHAPEALRLLQLQPSRYPSGRLQALLASLAVGEGKEARTVEVSINSPLTWGVQALYLLASHGPAALVRLSANDRAEQQLLLLRTGDGELYEARGTLGALELRLRGRVGVDGLPPGSLESRILSAGTLAFVGLLEPGQPVDFAGGRVELVQVRQWAAFQGTRDPSPWLAYLGFSVAIAGALIMFLVIKVDTLVAISPRPEGVRVRVALRAQRFSPLFAERFERLVQQHLG